MKLSNILNSNDISISCEIFPPKSGSELQNAFGIISKIADTGTDFMSVTYGAGGTSVGETVAIAAEIEKNGLPALAHLTCVGADESKIEDILSKLQASGIENVLALRGDLITEGDTKGSFAHASDLVAKIKSYGDFCVGGACYPQGHPEAISLDQDILNTKIKVESGCEFLVTQMVFENEILYNYMYRLMAKGINVPVVPGIMPVTNVSQIKRICELSGTTLPPHFRAIVEKFADKPEAMQQAGIAYATGQIVDLIANGFSNIHVYTMNKPEIIGTIRKNLSELLK